MGKLLIMLASFCCAHSIKTMEASLGLYQLVMSVERGALIDKKTEAQKNAQRGLFINHSNNNHRSNMNDQAVLLHRNVQVMQKDLHLAGF